MAVKAKKPKVQKKAEPAKLAITTKEIADIRKVSGVKKPKKDLVVPLLVGAIIIAAFGVGYLYGKVSVYEKLGVGGGGTQVQPAAQPQQAEAAPKVTKDQVLALTKDKKNIVLGNANKGLVFVEFSDPSCPYCHIAAGKNPELNAEAGDRFKLQQDGGEYVAPVTEIKKLVDQGRAAFVWAYSPGHGNGELATQALYCAYEQGKFWPVHDVLMSKEGYTLVNEEVQNDTQKIPVLVSKLATVVKAQDLQKCLESGKYADRVSSNTTLAREFGVSGTPSFFVNETNFGGAYSYTDIQATVDAVLK